MRRGIASWRVLPLAVLAAAIPATPASAVWRDVLTRDSPRSAIATCVRATGTPGQLGLLGPLERRTAPYDLLRVAPDGVARTDTVRLGILQACPAVAADPTGHAVVAGMVSRGGGQRVVASVAAPGAGFGRVVDLGSAGFFAGDLVAAVSPRGDAVVAWLQLRLPSRRDPGGGSRVVAALRQAGGSFGPPRHLTGWDDGFFLASGLDLAAGMDSAGAATVAWSHGVPHERRDLGTTAVAAASAPPGASFGRAQTLTRRAYSLSTIALAVAPNGAAVLAHDGRGIQRFTRATGSQRFERLGPVGSRTRQLASPAAAIARDGSAVLAWRTDDPTFATNAGVAMSERTGTGPFSAAHTVWAGEPPRDIGSAAIYLTASRRGVSAPADDDNTDLRASLGGGGRYLLAWGVRRRSALHDGPLGVRLADGVIGTSETRVRTLGCRCRAVNGVAPFVLDTGESGLAYVDNLSGPFSLGAEEAGGGGRLHVAADRPPVSAPRPPPLHLDRPRSQTLHYREGIAIHVRCGGPCDLRAYVVDRGRARGLGTALLTRAGRTRIAVQPGAESHLAPAHGVRATVLVRAWAPGGRRYFETSAPVILRRAPVRPLVRMTDVQAVREGSSIVVTWRTEGHGAGELFTVEGRRARGAPPVAFGFHERDGRDSFRVRLRPERRVPVASIRWVTITLLRGLPPNDHRAVTVPVTG
jgi:hypothetical protein